MSGDIPSKRVISGNIASGHAVQIIGDVITYNYPPDTGLPKNIDGSTSGKRKLSDLEIKCVRALYQSDYRQHRDRNPKRVEGTCEWFLKHEKFQAWRAASTSSLLWVSADAGCGKSVLASFLIDELGRNLAKSDASLCYFFFKDDNADQREAHSAFAALLHQAISDDIHLVEHALAEYQLKGKSYVTELRSLWEILLAMTSGEGHGRNIICILDGLDECEQKGRKRLIDTLEAFYSKLLEDSSARESRFYLKFLITTRPGILVQDKLFDLQTIRLRAEDETEAIASDIKTVVEYKISAIGKRRKLSDEQQRSLIEYLTGNADRTFLWVSLVVESIEKSPRFSKESLKQLLETTPSNLSGIYEKILAESTQSADTRKILGFVVGAYRPLTLDELNLAFVIRPRDRDYAELDLEPDLESTIKTLCGVFLRITKSTVYFAHQTAREFLLVPGESGELEHDLRTSAKSKTDWKHSFLAAHQHRVLFNISSWYLSFSVFESKSFHADGNVGDAQKAATVNQYLASHTMLGYVARFWPDHFSEAMHLLSPQELDSVMWLYDTQRPSFKTWFPIHWMTRSGKQGYSFGPERTSPLLIASHFGHNVVVDRMLQPGRTISRLKRIFKKMKDEPVNFQDDDDRSALSRAAANGRIEVVRILLREWFISINSMDNMHKTPLHYACQFGHLEIVKMLLDEMTIDVAPPVLGWKNTPLQLAAAGGHSEIALLLMSNPKTDINNKNSNGETALYAAAAQGSIPIVEALLARPDLDPNMTVWRTSPLHAAATNKNWEVFDILLKAAQATKEGFDLVGALVTTAGSGNITVFRRLLEMNPTLLNHKSSLEISCLTNAAGAGSVDVVKYLLGLPGIDVNIEDGKKRTPLSVAAYESQLETFTLLFHDPRTDINTFDDHHRNPIHNAVCSILKQDSMKEIVSLLLTHPKLQPDNKDCYGDTAFKLLCSKYQTDLISQLLARTDVDPNSSNREEMTALVSTVRYNEYLANCKLLVESGKVNLNTWDNYNRTPFMWACAYGANEAVEYLLTVEGVHHWNMANSDRKTGYMLAKENGKREVMRVIMLHFFKEHGVDYASIPAEYRAPIAEKFRSMNEDARRLMPLDLLWEAVEDEGRSLNS